MTTLREWVQALVSGGDLRRAALAAIAVIGLLLLAYRLLRPRRDARAARDLAALTRGPRRLGFLATGVFFAVFGAWSATAPLSSAAMAPGVVSPDGYRKTIQHLEGGIVRRILVREGDAVSAGQVLATLDDTASRSRRDEVRNRLAYFAATEARLIAEQSGAGRIYFPSELADTKDPVTLRAMASQEALLASRRAAEASRQQILNLRILQLDEQNKGLSEMIAAEEKEIALMREEIEGSQTLFAKGLEQKSRLLTLKRGEAQIEASIAEHRAAITENDQRAGETRMQLVTLREQDTERANSELTDVRRDLADLRSQLPAREDELARTEVRAPIAGRVMNLHINTATGVLRAGEPILDIVPDATRLIIDAQVRPTDIDNVQPGMRARVMLTAYRQRAMPQIQGVLRSISADSLRDEHGGRAFYLAQIEVDPEDLAGLGDVRLIPGMPAEVMILSGESTLLSYLTRPFVESITRSFREN